MIIVLNWLILVMTFGLVQIADVDYIDNNTPLVELNNNSLNDIFTDGNILPNPYFIDGFNSNGLPYNWSKYANASVSYNTDTEYMEVDTTGSLTNFYDTVDITCGDVYYISFHSYYDYTSGSYPRSRAVFRQSNGSWSQGFDFFGNTPTIHSLKHDSGLSQCKVEIGFLTDDIGNTVYVKQPYIINLTDLGIESVSQSDLDNYLATYKDNIVYDYDYTLNTLDMTHVTIIVGSFLLWTWLYKFLKGVVL